MAKVYTFSVSEPELIEYLNNLTDRSEFIRDAIREKINARRKDNASQIDQKLETILTELRQLRQIKAGATTPANTKNGDEDPEVAEALGSLGNW